MQNISEDAYCAGWMKDLEISLWEIVLIHGRKYGMEVITSERASEIAELAKLAGGWFIWNDEIGETFIEMPDWLEMFNQYESRKI